jgi:hypothetical protein
MTKKVWISLLAVVIAAGAAIPLAVGDDRPALANYTVTSNVSPYLGPWLDISTYNGKGVVAVHWKAS